MPNSRLRSVVSRIVVYTHRWLGIVLGALFLGWFVSGVVLMYAGMPRLAPTERPAGRAALGFARATGAPAAIADTPGGPENLQLSTVNSRPVFRIREHGTIRTF